MYDISFVCTFIVSLIMSLSECTMIIILCELFNRACTCKTYSCLLLMLLKCSIVLLCVGVFFLSIIISVYTSIQGIYMNSLRLTIEHVILE